MKTITVDQVVDNLVKDMDATIRRLPPIHENGTRLSTLEAAKLVFDRFNDALEFGAPSTKPVVDDGEIKINELIVDKFDRVRKVLARSNNLLGVSRISNYKKFGTWLSRDEYKDLGCRRFSPEKIDLRAVAKDIINVAHGMDVRVKSITLVQKDDTDNCLRLCFTTPLSHLRSASFRRDLLSLHDNITQMAAQKGAYIESIVLVQKNCPGNCLAL